MGEEEEMRLEDLVKNKIEDYTTFARRKEWPKELHISIENLDDESIFFLKDILTDDWELVASIPNNPIGYFSEVGSNGIQGFCGHTDTCDGGIEGMIAPKGTFSWALECMKIGVRVRRHFWAKSTYCEIIDNKLTIRSIDNANKLRIYEFGPGKNDFFSTDWEVYDVNKI